MAPKTDIQNQEIRKKSKQKIIDAAILLFSESGFAGTSISKIAKEAGVSKGLIYNYFETKEDIVKGIIDSLMEQSKETETAIMEAFQNASPQEIISLVLDQSLQFLTKHKAKWRLVTLFGFKMKDFPYIHDIMIQKYIGYVQLFTGVFMQLNVENPEMEAKLFAATLDGIAMQYLMFNDDEYPLEEKYQGLKNKYKND
ncbi:MAG: TetR/AcrR family transcriptional regulator [Chitinophagales bacterium]